MDNIGPIALFIIYMAISAWVKKNKAQRRVVKETLPVNESAPQESFRGGIFEQLKNELLGVERAPDIVQYEEPVIEPEAKVVIDDSPAQQFVEGSNSFIDNESMNPILGHEPTQNKTKPLDVLLEPYSTIEQGIILREILGKPRAYQDNEDWFHRS